MEFRLKAALAVGALAIGVTASAAYASWSSSGSGTGTAQSSHDAPSRITAAAFAPDLYPGATDTVTVSVDNPNPYPVVVTSIAAAQAGATNAGACAAGSVFTDAAANPSGLPQAAGAATVIAGHGSGVYALTGHMVGDPAEACKDQTFQLSLTATLQSAAS